MKRKLNLRRGDFFNEMEKKKKKEKSFEEMLAAINETYSR